MVKELASLDSGTILTVAVRCLMGVKTYFFIYSLPYKFIDFRCLEIVLMQRKNVTCIDIESKLKRIEEDPEGSGTTHLFKCMQGVCSLADRAFEPLFERQVG